MFVFDHYYIVDCCLSWRSFPFNHFGSLLAPSWKIQWWSLPPTPPFFFHFLFPFPLGMSRNFVWFLGKMGGKTNISHDSWLPLFTPTVFFFCLCNWDHFPNKSIFSPKMVQSIFGLMLATTKIKIIYKFKLNYEYKGSY